MSFEVVGKLYKKFNTENKTQTFRAREFVIEIPDGNYPQMIKFQLVQDRCDILDAYQEGDEIKVFFDLRGREWNEKFFTNLNAWRLEKTSAETAAPQAPPAPATEAPFPDASEAPSQQVIEDDDLPF